MRNRHRLVKIVCTAALLLSAAAGVATAAPGPTGTGDPASVGDLFGMTADQLQNSTDLQDFKTWLIGQPGLYDAGFVVNANDADTRSTTLLWAGAENAFQDAVVAEARRRGITATIQHVRYSHAQLEAGAKDLFAAADNAGWAGFKITAIAETDLTHDGLEVTGYYPDSVLAAARLPVGQLAVVAEGILASDPGLAPIGADPLSVTVELGHPPLLFSRNNDTSPFYAGGYMAGPAPSYCSSGFAITLANGTHHITTARHCDDTPYHSRDAGGAYHNYGYTNRRVDPGAGRVLNGAGSPYVFTGRWNESTTMPVKYLADLSIDDIVFPSGGNSGLSTGFTVQNLTVYVDDGYGTFSAIKSHNYGGGFVCHGDSGGPVIATGSGGKVRAAGMIQGDWYENQFWEDNHTYVHDATYCSHGLEFTSMRTIINGIPGASLYNAP